MKAMNRRRALSTIGMSGLTVIAGHGCAVNPVTGKRQFMLMSEEQEIALGRKAHGQILQSYGTFDNNAIQGWFNERGQEMARISHRPNLEYTFNVLDSPVMNAFAVPGGFVYVTRGILAYFNDEAQFAGVLAHEIGHITFRHSAARYSKAQLANLSLGIGSIFVPEFNQYAQLVNLGTSLLFLKFSRDNEREADRMGVEYSSKVGYDATHMSEFFTTLERMRPKGGSLPEWQSTHPDPGDRVDTTFKMASNIQAKSPDREWIVRREQYLERIDGIIFGDDPNHGYVEDGVFYHPGMAFQFPVPDGWNVLNQPSEVRMVPGDQQAIFIFNMAEGASPHDASVRFASANNITVADRGALTVNGMTAEQTVGVLEGDGGQYGIRSWFIQMDDKIFAFHGLSAVNAVSNYEPIFGSTARGFSRLTDTRYLEVSPDRIAIRTLPSSTVARRIFTGQGMTDEKAEEQCLLNGWHPEQVITGGLRYKIVT